MRFLKRGRNPFSGRIIVGKGKRPPLLSEALQMKPTYTAVVKRDGRWWIGWIEEMNRRDARRAAGKKFEELPIGV